MTSRQKRPHLSFTVLYIGAFLDWMSYGLVYPLFSLMIFHHDPLFLAAASNATRAAWLGILMAASPFGQFFAAPILGILSDRFGRRPILQLSYLLIITGYLLSALGIWEHSFLFLILGRLTTGIGAGNISVINAAIADLSDPDKKASNFALLAMISGLGFTAGPYIGGKLSMLSFDTPFILSGILTLVTFLFFNLVFAETHSKKEKTASSFMPQLFRFMHLHSFSKFRILFSTFFIFCFGWSFYWEFIPVTWIKIYGQEAEQIGNFYAYGSAFYVLSSGLLIRPIIKRFNPRAILACAWLALGICFILLFHAKIDAYWVYIPIQQFFVALIFPVGIAIVSNAATEKHQGEVLGTFQSLQSFAFAITPLISGILLDFTYHMPLIIGSITMLLASFILFMKYRSRYI
ncbi:MAG: MFS transporter [Chlamydiota bacterium]